MPGRPFSLRLVVTALLVVTVSTQPVFLVGAAFFQIGPELGLGPFGLGALTAAFFLAASAVSPPLGRWVQRVGWQKAMRIDAVGAGLVMLATAVVAQGPWSFGMLLAVSAAFYGLANPAANQALAESTDPGRQATVFGLKHAGIPSSTMLAGVAVPLVIVNLGWRASFAISAGLALLVAMAIPSASAVPPLRPEAAVTSRPRPPAMSLRWLIGLAVGSSLATWAAIALGSYGVLAAIEAGLREGAAGWLQFAGSVATIATRVAVGVVTDRIEGWGFGGVALLSGAGAVVMIALVAASGWWFAILMVVAFTTAWGWPGLMTFTVVNANRGSVAASSSITQAGVFLGAGIGPLVLGAVIERWSYDGGWVVAAVALLAASAIVATVGHRFHATALRPAT